MAIVEQIEESELKHIANLEQLIFSDPWSERSLLDTMKSKHGHIVACKDEKSGAILAYLIYYCMGDEIELARIATALEVRGQGVGILLMEHLQREAVSGGSARILLEVRVGNITAINLYTRCGYKSIGVRKAYYSDPLEDGNIMEKVL